MPIKVSMGPEGGKRRVVDVIAGREGAGKTTLASYYPDPLFIPVEEGTGDIKVLRTPVPENWKDLFDLLDEIPKDAKLSKKGTLVLDGVDAIERLIWGDITGKAGKTIEEVGGGYGKGYNQALDYWRILFSRLDNLRRVCGMGIVMPAHTQSKTQKDPSGDYHAYRLRLQDADKVTAAGLLLGWAENVFFVTWEEFFDENTSKIVCTGKRLIRTVEDGPWKAKNRIEGLPNVFTYEKGDPADRVTVLVEKLPDDKKDTAKEAIIKAAGHPVILLHVEQRIRKTLAEKEKK